MNMFSKMMKISDEIISKVYSIPVKYKEGIMLKGILSSPNVVIEPNDFHLATILQKKILEITKSDYDGDLELGEKIEIEGRQYVISEIIFDDLGNRKVVLETYEN